MSLPLSLEERLQASIRDVADFPRPGIVFKDLTPVLCDARLCADTLERLAAVCADRGVEAIVGIESRGFLFGFPLAMRLGLPFVPVRKAGKLPGSKIAESYELEYGSATVEMHLGALRPGQRVWIHDDLLATGGSASAAAALVSRAGALPLGFGFLIELGFLQGRQRLEQNYGLPVEAVLRF